MECKNSQQQHSLQFHLVDNSQSIEFELHFRRGCKNCNCSSLIEAEQKIDYLPMQILDQPIVDAEFGCEYCSVSINYFENCSNCSCNHAATLGCNFEKTFAVVFGCAFAA
ncbi:hypothetical protein BpHYR1_038089 [Brachionus plicatilis]|uniref:Uncharacterized protein n=1 Tax=Brachionus plicatilis TaxID=10195 RepID=A0A3M7Q3W3_BRAPC|nr:hypothetical protein BpHYR1_038089 [Brachionus plicatilis]